MQSCGKSIRTVIGKIFVQYVNKIAFLLRMPRERSILPSQEVIVHVVLVFNIQLCYEHLFKSRKNLAKKCRTISWQFYSQRDLIYESKCIKGYGVFLHVKTQPDVFEQEFQITTNLTKLMYNCCRHTQRTFYSRFSYHLKNTQKRVNNVYLLQSFSNVIN